MSNTAQPPQNPAGEFVPEARFSDAQRAELTKEIGRAPSQLREAVANLECDELDTRYRNWTVRQIAHHLADSHLHSLIRFKWALTEDNPLIKAYEEADWVELPDSKQGDLDPALALLEGIHQKWVQLLQSMTSDQFDRTFRHPQSGETVSLAEALEYYAWHGKHHIGQILWLRDRHGWNQTK